MADGSLVDEAIEAAARAVAGRRVLRRTDDGDRWGTVRDLDLAIGEDGGEPSLWVLWDSSERGEWVEEWELGDHRSIYGPPDPRETSRGRHDVVDMLIASLLARRSFYPEPAFLGAPGPMAWVEDRLTAQDGRAPDRPGGGPPPRPV